MSNEVATDWAKPLSKGQYWQDENVHHLRGKSKEHRPLGNTGDTCDREGIK